MKYCDYWIHLTDFLSAHARRMVNNRNTIHKRRNWVGKVALQPPYQKWCFSSPTFGYWCNIDLGLDTVGSRIDHLLF